MDTRRRRTRTAGRVRGTVAAVLAAVAAFALVASTVGLWAAHTTLNTDRWVATVAPLPKDPQVSAAVAQYTTTQVFEVLDVEQRVRAALPDKAAFVAAPLTGQLRDYLQRTITTVLRSDRFQPLWLEVNRRAHQRALAVIQGRSEIVRSAGDRVSIDLLPLINQVLRELSARLPTLFGHQLALPDLDSGAIPDNLRARVQDTLGVPLPANFAQFTFYDAGRLAAAQRAVVTIRRDLAILVGATLAALVLALVVSVRRRRTILQFGVWLVVAAVAVTASLRVARGQLLAQVPAGVYRDGAAAAITTVTGTLRQRGFQLIWLGVLLAAIAYLVGPGRVPVWLRRQLGNAGRAAVRATRTVIRPLAARSPAWIAAHRDVVRIAGVAVAAALALLLSSWSALLVTALALAAYEVAVTLVARAGTRTAPR
ncbi:MAG: hypothetical protein AUI10_13020 [Actinobacteria bacterium 13_2_20CM_2_72_6]|nr:MAG: hypothetical protein AUI10_13020 [Actinobacteria bacterium 13_2_20CM_2_72_6]